MENTAKILLLGKTGVGKSAFINYFLGKEVAKSAAGKPVTQEYFIPYEIRDGKYPIEIYDTKGLETKEAYTQLDKIIEGIKEKNNSNNIFNWFHTIFYCVSMNRHFEDFEANFIHTLQKELSQHIHIILTHCDTVEPVTISHMKEKIISKLDKRGHFEIFEVVCVEKRKRNGTIVFPHGKVVIVKRVFDLLIEDVADKISRDYARTLRDAMIDAVDQCFKQLNDMIDKEVNLKTLIEIIQDEDSANMRFDKYMKQIERDMKKVQNDTDQHFNKILHPVTKLYKSYKGVVTDSFVADAGLSFDAMMDYGAESWLDSMDDNAMLKEIAPGMGQYLGADGELNIDDSSPFEMLKAIVMGVGDLFNLKKNLKKFCGKYSKKIIEGIPDETKLQQEAYGHIVQFIKNNT